MKQILALILFAGLSALVLHAEAKVEVEVEKLNTGKLYQITLADDSISSLKEEIKAKTGVKIELQRLYHKGDQPITELIAKLSDLKPEPAGKPYTILMRQPLEPKGAILVTNTTDRMGLYVKGKETLGSLKKRIYKGDVYFREYLLKDDAKTLNFYQIGYGDTLTVLEKTE